MRALLNLTTNTTILFVASMLLARAIGGIQQPEATSMIDAGKCTQPCWHGLQPGESHLEQVQESLDASPDFVVKTAPRGYDNERCWTLLPTPDSAWRVCTVYLYAPGNTISLIRLTPPAGEFRLGDAMALFGSPVASTICGWSNTMPNMPRMVVMARLYFGDNVEVWAYNRQNPLIFAYDPTMVVYLVSYHSANDWPLYQSGTPRWQGFVRLRRRPNC
jgi:hypothetical protein